MRIPEDVLELHIRNHVTPRTANALERYRGIQTFGELLQYPQENLLAIPNFGVKSLAEVFLALRDVGASGEDLEENILKLGGLPKSAVKKKKEPPPKKGEKPVSEVEGERGLIQCRGCDRHYLADPQREVNVEWDSRQKKMIPRCPECGRYDGPDRWEMLLSGQEDDED